MFECIFSQKLMHKIFNLILGHRGSCLESRISKIPGSFLMTISESYSYDRKYECIVKAIYEIFKFKVPTWSHTRLKFIQTLKAMTVNNKYIKSSNGCISCQISNTPPVLLIKVIHSTGGLNQGFRDRP